MSKKYIFDGFVLLPDGVLSYGYHRRLVPPKEHGVLTVLLEKAGELVSKELLIDRVWEDNNTSDESLARCIYILRSLLRESKGNRYIETIYGKGYRFNRPVAVVSQSANTETQCSIAVLPFQMPAALECWNLYDALLQSLLSHASSGLRVLPTTITRSYSHTEDMLSLIRKLHPDYYLSAHVESFISADILRLELTRTKEHRLLHCESMIIDFGESLITQARSWIMQVLRYIPELCFKHGEHDIWAIH